MAAVRVLENSLLDVMAADASLLAAFPGCLGPLASAPLAACGKCGGRKVRPRQAYDEAKRCLLAMGEADRADLKARLRTDQIKVSLAGSKGVEHYQF